MGLLSAGDARRGGVGGVSSVRSMHGPAGVELVLALRLISTAGALLVLASRLLSAAASSSVVSGLLLGGMLLCKGGQFSVRG